MTQTTSMVAPRVTPLRVPARSVSVMVVDTRPVVYAGVRSLVWGAAGIGRVDGAASGEEAVAIARRHRPDVVLLDPWLDDMLLADAVGMIRSASPGSSVLVFASSISTALREEVPSLDVRGILGKDSSAARLLEAIHRVAGGGCLDMPSGSDVLRRAAFKLNGTALTVREQQVLRRVAQGESNAEIALSTFLSPATVKAYMQSALRKLGAKNRAQAVIKALELRIL